MSTSHPRHRVLVATHAPQSAQAGSFRQRVLGFVSAGVVLLALGACSTTRVAAPAPVEDRQPVPSVAIRTDGPASSQPSVSAPAMPGAENAGKPGYYTVRPGDSLIRIGLDVGQNWRDLVRWNALENPNKLEIGQVLRVVSPAADNTPSTPVGAAPVANTAGVVGQPLPAAKPLPASTPAAATSTPSAPAAAATQASVAKHAEDSVTFIWPAEGVVLAGFDDAKNKGVDIGGKAGQSVLAAAEGRVVYAGAAVRGFGNLIILKHSNTLLSAYAHNQTLLVKEDQTVKQGQKIAEMGSSDADRVKLHFEIRRQGKPVDPVKLLPPR